MDIYDFAVVQPRRQELLNNCNFKKLRKPHDAAATTIGLRSYSSLWVYIYVYMLMNELYEYIYRWYQCSGAEAMATENKVSYQDYLRDGIQSSLSLFWSFSNQSVFSHCLSTYIQCLRCTNFSYGCNTNRQRS